jgi:uncharacterized membrane protein YfhO
MIATVNMRRPGIAVLSASFDPGWKVSVDGHQRPARMIAPALVGVEVQAGTHALRFRYQGYGYYPELLTFGGTCLIALLLADIRRKKSPLPRDPG